jgi:hypothetical protein
MEKRKNFKQVQAERGKEEVGCAREGRMIDQE